MKIEIEISNVIKHKKGDLAEAYLYYSNDYDDYTILIISHGDDVDRIYHNFHIDNKYYNTKEYAIKQFDVYCNKYYFDRKEIIGK